MTQRMTAEQFRTTTKGKRQDVEGPIHKGILELLRLYLPGALVHHSPNEMDMAGDAEARARAIARAASLGTVKGWPDIEILWRGQFWALEVKAPGNGPSPEQQAVGEAIEARGGCWAWCHRPCPSRCSSTSPSSRTSARWRPRG